MSSGSDRVPADPQPVAALAADSQPVAAIAADSQPVAAIAATYADVIIDDSGPHLDRFFTYRLPAEQAGEARPGQYVKVPWGKSTRGAVIAVLRDQRPEGLAEEAVREILEVCSAAPLLLDHGWELARWVKEFYFAGWPEVLQTLLPGPVLQGMRRAAAGVKKRKSKKAAAEGQAPELESAPELTAGQSRVWEELRPGLTAGGTYLLHGVTGSGKTEIYMRACQNVLESGRGVLKPRLASSAASASASASFTAA